MKKLEISIVEVITNTDENGEFFEQATARISKNNIDNRHFITFDLPDPKDPNFLGYAQTIEEADIVKWIEKNHKEVLKEADETIEKVNETNKKRRAPKWAERKEKVNEISKKEFKQHLIVLGLYEKTLNFLDNAKNTETGLLLKIYFEDAEHINIADRELRAIFDGIGITAENFSNFFQEAKKPKY